jgi:hypothetical protein
MVRTLRSFFVFMLVPVVTSMALAQTTSARLTGTVADRSGALIPKVRVTVHNTGTNLTQSTESDGSGTYLFTVLPPGQYSLIL